MAYGDKAVIGVGDAIEVLSATAADYPIYPIIGGVEDSAAIPYGDKAVVAVGDAIEGFCYRGNSAAANPIFSIIGGVADGATLPYRYQAVVGVDDVVENCGNSTFEDCPVHSIIGGVKVGSLPYRYQAVVDIDDTVDVSRADRAANPIYPIIGGVEDGTHSAYRNKTVSGVDNVKEVSCTEAAGEGTPQASALYTGIGAAESIAGVAASTAHKPVS